MSVRVMTMVFDRYPRGGGEMLLALALADHAHDDGTHIFPEVATLAAKTRQSVRTVQYHLREMEAAGWLEVVANAHGGRGRSREYRIHDGWIKGAEIAPFSESNGAIAVAPFVDKKGCNLRHERVQTDVLKGATAIAPAIEPYEPSLTIKTSPADGGSVDNSESQPTRQAVEVAAAEADEYQPPADPADGDGWQSAINVLHRGGCPKNKARGFLGLLVKEFGLSVVQRAVAATDAAAPVDARAYMRAACKRLAAAPVRSIPDAQETAEEWRRAELTPDQKEAADAARLKAVARIRQMREAWGLGPPGA